MPRTTPLASAELRFDLVPFLWVASIILAVLAAAARRLPRDLEAVLDAEAAVTDDVTLVVARRRA